MGTDLTISNRAGLATYAGLASTSRGRRIAVIAAVDILAVGLALGALHIAGAMMGAGRIPDIIPPVSAAEPVTTDTPLVPVPRLAPPQPRLAAAPDAALLFAAPVDVAQGFTFEDRFSAASTFTTEPAATTPHAQTAAVAPEPASPAPAVPSPHLRPVSRMVAEVQPVVDATDGSLDRLLLRDVLPSIGRTATTAARGADAVVTQVASAAPIQSVTQSVTQTVGSTVGQVTGAVRGLLN
jgi:hypothetical protein